jgi:putative ABC transport system permease protein
MENKANYALVGVFATVVIGAVAGIVPALRAAAQHPTEALGTG